LNTDKLRGPNHGTLTLNSPRLSRRKRCRKCERERERESEREREVYGARPPNFELVWWSSVVGVFGFRAGWCSGWASVAGR